MKRLERTRKFFRENFFSGLLVVVPVVVSVYIFYYLLAWLYNKIVILPIDNELIARKLDPFIPDWGMVSAIKMIHVAEFAIALVILIILTALIGLITKIGLVNWVFRIGERWLERVPLLGTIYTALKQLLQAIFSGKGNFRKVVLVQFPRDGLWSVGFLSRESDETFEHLIGREQLYHVFVPTTPNVTTGFLIIVPKEDVIELEVPVDDAFKFILSGGMVLPHEELEDDDESLAGMIKSRLGDRSGRRDTDEQA